MAQWPPPKYAPGQLRRRVQYRIQHVMMMKRYFSNEKSWLVVLYCFNAGLL